MPRCRHCWHEPTWTWLPRYKHIRAEKHKGENFEAFVGAIVTALEHADIHDVSQLLEHRARDPKLRELEMPKKQQREWLRVNACCPGWCATDMSSHRGPRSAADGARNAVVLITGPREECPQGAFYQDEKPSRW